MLTTLALLIASQGGGNVRAYASGQLVGATDLSAVADKRYRVKEVVRFWIDRPSKIQSLKVALAGNSGDATVHVWRDIDHEWPFYRFEEDAVAPIHLKLPRGMSNKWLRASLEKQPIVVRNSGYVYVGIVHKVGSPQFAIDRKLDHPDNSRYEVFDTSNPHAEEVYWPKPKGDYAVALEVRPMPKAAQWFEDVSDREGLRSARGDAIAWADVDGDGWEDLCLSGHKIYRNVKGSRFEDMSDSAGLDRHNRFGVLADIDGDGDADMFSGGDEDRLYLNNGSGRFGVAETKFDVGWYARCASIFDYDQDGKLDIFVAYGEDGVEARNRLWRNLGGGKFALAPCLEINGAAVRPAFTFSSTAADLDLDGSSELAVLGFRLLPNQLWRFGKFGATDFSRKLDFDQSKSPAGALSGGNSTGVGIGDLNGDGIPDMWVANLMHPDWRGFEASIPSQIFMSQSSGPHRRSPASRLGVAFDESPSDPTFGDFDNDGDLDVYVSSKYHRGDVYENRGGTFVEVTYQSGVRADRGESSAVCDYDHDGRLDLAAQTKGNQIKLYRNVTPKRNWIEVVPNDQSVGATVRVFARGHKILRQVIVGKGLGSQDAKTLHFGLGSVSKIESIDILGINGKWVRSNVSAVNKRIAI